MVDLVQGSPEWLAARCGSLGASQINHILNRVGASRATLLKKMVQERLTGIPAKSFKSEAMQWGIDTEEHARMAYEMDRGLFVELVALVVHPTIKHSHASPDGLVGNDGLIEIKCPNTLTHRKTLASKVIPTTYTYQMQWQMACTGRLWCDFVSFDPRVEPENQLFVKRLERKKRDIDFLEVHVGMFLEEVENTLERVKNAN